MRSKAVLILLVLALGCSKSPKSEVVGSVNGRDVTRAQFEAFLELKRIPKDDAARRDAALADYLEREALADVIAAEPGLDKTLLAAELREHEKELVISRYYEKLLEDKVSDDAVRSYYAAHTDDYSETKIRVAHVLLRTNARMTDEERKAKLTAAQEAHSRLKKGEDFAAVAQALSEDKTSAAKGGDLGLLREGSVDPRFSQKVFAMKKDELSEPFESAFGFHVVKVLEAPQKVTRPFEAVQGDIRYLLRAEAKKAETERLAGKLKVQRADGKPIKPAAKSKGKEGSARSSESESATAKRD